MGCNSNPNFFKSSEGMSLKKTNTAGGVITFHTPFPLSFLKSTESKGNLKDSASCVSESRKSLTQRSVKMRRSTGGVRAGNREEAWVSRPPQGPQIDWLSPTSLRRLQAKTEAENQQAREIIQPLVDTENDFVKELDSFLSWWDTAKLRRRELLHKRWTDRVWTPIQKRVEEHMSSCYHEEAKRRRSLYSHYLHYCNTKGFVFLDIFDPQEYNPFQKELRKPSRVNMIPCHITAAATPDGRCHQIGCWSSRR